MDKDIFKEQFAARLTQLLDQNGTKAREMSLAIGQDPSYINSIQNQRMLPSMTVFSYICDFLSVSPSEFFNYENAHPAESERLLHNFKKLSPEKQACMLSLSELLQDK